MACFADDFAAVIDQLTPGRRVHVMGHDWGSVGIWEYLTRPGAGDRVASFTSVSGRVRNSWSITSGAGCAGHGGRDGFSGPSPRRCG
ncbi:alpha/beta hydrolase family protein [Mycobacterium kansasii]|uniref:Alpha/beta hydrolase family protein n=1 Tax=Mycobacterium kansasii TaxID=1768 RepID=A0A1V3WYX6_MYCKA|nr:alpha/beta hydrolase family protein [Mycobacterium kansasii]